MKTLILLLTLLLAGTAWGQDNTKSNLDMGWSMYFPDTSFSTVRHGNDTLTRSMNPWAALAMNQLVHLWREYKAECAETVKVATGCFSRTVELHPPHTAKFGKWEPDSVLRPRNPYPNATDFLDWLSERIKR